MRLRNKKTGEIVEAHEIDLIDNYAYLKIFRAGDYDTKQYNSLAELNEEWTDYEEEPNTYWYITSFGEIKHRGFSLKKWGKYDDDRKQIGNYFLSKEEVELAVRKLKAWKRLKDKGFKFVEHQIHGMTEDGEGDGCAYFEFDKPLDKSDLDILFSGGEE